MAHALPPPPGRRRARAIAAAAVVVVLVVVVAVVVRNRNSRDTAGSPTTPVSNSIASTSAATATTPTTTTPTTTTPTTTTPTTTTPTTTTPTTTTPTTTPSPTPTTTAPITPKTTPATPKVTLVVMNNTGRAGLASTARSRFEAKGWKVTDVANFSGRVISTCAFYDPANPANKPAAEALRKQFPAIKRVEPRFTRLPSAPIVVVITEDYR